MASESAPTTRQTAARWLVAIGAASIGAAMIDAPRSLADPASCPGLLELFTVIASRTASDVPVATLLLWGNRLAMFAALVIFARLVQTIGSGLVATAAITIALAMTPIFAPVLAPSPAAALGAAAVALLLIARATALSSRGVWPAAAACLAIAVQAAIAPAFTLPGAAVAAIVAAVAVPARGVARKSLFAIAAASVVVMMSIAVALALPALPVVDGSNASVTACLAPASWSIAGGVSAIAAGIGGVAPLALGIAVLGAFANRLRGIDRATVPVLAFAIAPLAAVCWSSGDALRTLAPSLAGLWCLTALGLRDLDAALANRPARRVVALMLTLAVPWLQHARENTSGVPDAQQTIRGHDRLSPAQFNDIAGALPNAAALVAEDAITDLLARDSFRRLQRRGKALRVVAPNAHAVGAALESVRVFALPRAQSGLQHQAFQLTDSGGGKVTGLAEVQRGGTCGVAGFDWTDLPTLQSRAGMAAITEDGRTHWHVVIYIGGRTPVEVRRDGWPDQPGLGYHATAYDRDRDAERRALDEHVRGDAAPGTHAIFSARYVTRLEIWRAQGGPGLLAIGFAAPDIVIARARADAGDTRVQLCPSFPYDVGEIGRK